MAIEVQSGAGGFAGEICGANPETEADFSAIHQAFLDHGVIVMRRHSMTPEAQLTFSRRFGPLMGRRPSTPEKVLMPGLPESVVLSNRKVNGKTVGITDAGRYWHSDLCFEEVPNMATILHAIEVPPEGGDTLFADLRQAYETLPEALKVRIEDKRAAHTFRKHYLEVMAAGSPRPPLTKEQFEALALNYPPIVRTHPETGRKALYIGRRQNTYVNGLPMTKSEALLDALWAHADERGRRTLHHRWRGGDLMIWDNRCGMHRRDAFSPDVRRVMHRTQIQSDLAPA